jgi:hypothetical protein
MEKTDDSKDSFYDQLEQILFCHFIKYHLKIILRECNSKVGGEYILKPTSANDSLHHDSNDNGDRIINFAM